MLIMAIFAVAFAGVSPASGAAQDRTHQFDPVGRQVMAQPRINHPIPLPREAVRLTGQLAGGRRPVVLQAKSGAGWSRVARSVTTNGHYEFRLLVKRGEHRYRVSAPRYQGARSANTRPIVIRTLTGALFWKWDGIWRGSTDPDVWGPACRKRDSAIKRGGPIIGRDFADAWRRKD